MGMDGTLRRRWSVGTRESEKISEKTRAADWTAEERDLSSTAVVIWVGIIVAALVFAVGAAVAGDAPAGAAHGEGWVASAPGAYALDRGLSGRGEFTMEASRAAGGKDAQGRITFDLGGGAFAFKSTACDWLSLSGGELRMSGSGVVGGRGDYGFILAARDGKSTDGLRLEVWDRATGEMVYANSPVIPRAHRNSLVKAIGGGSIEIQEFTATDSFTEKEQSANPRPPTLYRWR